MANHYAVLGVPHDASLAAIEKAYLDARALAIGDAGATPEVLSERLRALDAAHAELIDPAHRTMHDGQLAAEALLASPASTPGSVALTVSSPAQLGAGDEIDCPNCGAQIPVQAMLCPECGHQVFRPCPKCGERVAVDKSVCPRCRTYLPEFDRQRYADAESVAQSVQLERVESRKQKAALDAINSVKERYACLFWLVVVAMGITLLVLISMACNASVN